MMISEHMRTWAEIDLSAIRDNLGVVREKIGPQAGVAAVVKADAYGHGMEAVAKALAQQVELFGVANLEEAQRIRHLGRDVMLFSPSLPAERKAVVEGDFIATVSSAAEAKEFSGGRINFKVDTGMGRIGSWQDDATKELQGILELKQVAVHSISTHLPVADEDETFTRAQLERFADLTQTFRALAPQAKIHALNSAGILRFPGHAHDFVRPGLVLYGSAYPAEFQTLLRPALTWKTRIVLVRDVAPSRSLSYGRTFITKDHTRVATLAVGYADGYPRQVSGEKAEVLIGGKRCAVLGRVTMDQILADVTKVPQAAVGDEAVLIGAQGDEEILARELAEKAGTIAWDIFTGLGARVKKFHF
jgi:alanine racemase